MGLIEEGVDCAVRPAELEDSSLIVRRIGIMPMMTCAAPDYLRRHGTPERLDDLSDHVAVTFLIGHTRRTMDWKFRIQGKTIAENLRSSIVVDDSEALVGCGIAGLGLVHGPRRMIKQATQLTITRAFKHPK